MAGSAILANGVTEILKKLSSVVANEITLVWDVNDELKNLQSALNMILAVMEDAEKKQLSSKTVGLWMEELKAIAYDAEDILDEYSYEVIICKREQEEEEYKSTVLNKVRNLFSSSKPSFKVIRKLAHQIKEINEKFKKVATRKNDLGLQTMDLGSSSSSLDMNMMMMNRETYSFIADDWKIVGRENDKSNIIKMLLEEEEENSSNNICSTNQGGGKHVSVIPIVGMGGLGKTTMAQLVYNDEAVKRHFDIKLWICVSDPFDVKKIFKNIAKSLDENAICEDATTMENIVCKFQKHLIGEKFLLVLDDVWNENTTDWHKLRTPLMVGAKGSKILITTRSVEVARIMIDKFPPYHLGNLNENDSWSLFKEIAFGSTVGAEETPNLVEIGKNMVYRCKGVALAVIFLGRLMRSKKKEEEWEIIRDTKLWYESRHGKKFKNEILPSLRLSYDYLPSHLKVCFSYCCLFPKDSIIHRKTLIRLWMAEGFLIESPGENTMSMEEVGNEYFHSLLCTFFFQDAEKDGDIETCKMHDLVHDLARSVVGKNECLIVESVDDIGLISETTRRLNLVNLDDGEMLPKVLEALKKAKNLRTVFVDSNQQPFCLDIGNAFKENKRLRVLDLSGYGFMTESISVLGRLKHLRYLYVDDYFPMGMIGRLSFLQTLSEFNVGDKNGVNVIEELEGLNLLRDLTITDLGMVTSGKAACRANLKEKKNLRGLNLFWVKGEINNNYEVVVLEGLQPHPNLRTLCIGSFPGAKLPRWIQDSSCLPNLVELQLIECKYMDQVVGFGALPSLRSLTLKFMHKLECIGNEFYYSSAAAGESLSSAGGKGGESSTGEASTTTTTTKAFPSLKILKLSGMGSLKEWVVPPPSTTRSTNYCFPLLEKIEIKECRKFTIITPTTTVFPSLKVLWLDYIDGRAAKTLFTNNLNSLTSLTLYKITNLISLPRQGLLENNNTLLSLLIERCYEFEGFLPPNKDKDEDDQLQISQVVSSTTSSSSSLQSLRLCNCPYLRFFPNIHSLTSLRELVIENCREKESRSFLDEHDKILKKKTATTAEKV